MPPHGYLVFGTGSPLPGHHDEGAADAFDAQHGFVRVAIKFLMQPPDEIHGSGLGQPVLRRHPVYLFLDPDMGCGFALEIAAARVRVELAGEGAFDVARAGVVAFDEIAVVGVHDAHEIGEVGGRARVEALAERGSGCGQLGQGIRDLLRHLFQPGWLNA